jgi:O-acetyl-ADP-ribose deacetylase (regulator of RNase III)
MADDGFTAVGRLDAPTTDELLVSCPAVALSGRFFDQPALYTDDCGGGGAIVLVNNSNADLSFGGGGTNGAICRYFFPEQARCLCGLLRRGRQSRHVWRALAGGLHRNYPDGGNGGLVPDVNMLPHPPGSIWYTPLPEARRRGTRVTNIVHVVGPKNNADFAKGDGATAARVRASAIVRRMTARVLRLAEDELKAETVVLAGISSGIFAQGDQLWSAAMYAAMRSAISAHILSSAEIGDGSTRRTTATRSLKVVLVGSWQGGGVEQN